MENRYILFIHNSYRKRVTVECFVLCFLLQLTGTGKTLVARALANECSQDGQKVAFFMRKGADCLSKWVGESERQLRLLFDQVDKKAQLECL